MKEPTDKMALRRMFLNEGKTQFVFLKFIFTSQELLTEKPSVLLAQIYEHLSLEKKNFKVASFRMWLFRYRKSNKPTSPSTATIVSKTTETNLNADLSAEKKERTPFKFTDPATLKKKDDIILEYVQPIKNNT